MLSQLARIAAIHMIDELVLVKDNSFVHRNKEFSSIGSLTKIFQYLETPQYLRKNLFPISQDLKFVGKSSS
jgi:predicted SPOUT superfamily RNA methylase MTH1